MRRKEVQMGNVYQTQRAHRPRTRDSVETGPSPHAAIGEDPSLNMRAVTELETRSLAGLPVNVSIEEVDQSQGLKLALDNGAQAMTIPGIDLASLSAARRTEALQKLNSQPCTCGCDLTVAKCRVDDPSCGVSLPLAQQIVKQIAGVMVDDVYLGNGVSELIQLALGDARLALARGRLDHRRWYGVELRGRAWACLHP